MCGTECCALQYSHNFYIHIFYFCNDDNMYIYLGQGEVQKLSSTMRFEELPHSLLAEIASYTRSRNKKSTSWQSSDILLAVALSGSTKSWEQCQSTDTMQLLSPASKAVLSMNTDDWGKRFELFDFGHLQSASGSKSPHEKLNDVGELYVVCL